VEVSALRRAAGASHGWLAATLPAGAERFCAHDPTVAEALRAAGGRLGLDEPDVEIGRVDQLRTAAPSVIVHLSAEPPRGRLRMLRAGLRLIRGTRLALRATAARRVLRRRGYGAVRLLTWERGEPLRSGPELRGLRPLAHRLPLNAVLAAHRSALPRTVLDAACDDVRAATGAQIPADPIVGSSGVLVVVGEREVLRAGIGTGRVRVEAQRDALDAISAAGPRAVTAVMPQILAAGKSGLAAWTLERRLPGTALRAFVPGLLDECVAFLVELHTAGRDVPGDDELGSSADVVAGTAGRQAERLRDLAALLVESLAGLPRGFAHGDFWHGNLLVEAGRLTGVVDWAAAGAGRLPLLDLMHLRASAARERAGESLGWAVVQELLPWSRSGGNDVSLAYCRRVGFDPDSTLLARLVGAYWLTGVARELRDFDRTKPPAEDAGWVTANVKRPLSALLDANVSCT